MGREVVSCDLPKALRAAQKAQRIVRLEKVQSGRVDGMEFSESLLPSAVGHPAAQQARDRGRVVVRDRRGVDEVGPEAGRLQPESQVVVLSAWVREPCVEPADGIERGSADREVGSDHPKHRAARIGEPLRKRIRAGDGMEEPMQPVAASWPGDVDDRAGCGHAHRLVGEVPGEAKDPARARDAVGVGEEKQITRGGRGAGVARVRRPAVIHTKQLQPRLVQRAQPSVRRVGRAPIVDHHHVELDGVLLACECGDASREGSRLLAVRDDDRHRDHRLPPLPILAAVVLWAYAGPVPTSRLEAALNGRTVDRDPLRIMALSPHCDDAVWSLGGLIARLASGGSLVQVVTAFDQITPDISSVGSALLQRAGLSASEASRERRSEDATACATVQATAVHLGLLDAVSRCPAHYATPHDLAGGEARVASSDPGARQLHRKLMQFVGVSAEPVVLLAPLAVGGHVDHLISAAVAVGMSDAFAEVWLYGEFPYAVNRVPTIEMRVGRIFRHSRCRRLDVDVTAYTALHLAASRSYRSQIGLFYRTEDDFTRSLAGHLDAEERAAGHVTLYGPLPSRVSGTPTTLPAG